MKNLLNIIFYIGVIGTIGKYAGVEFFKDYSLWVLIMLAGGGIGRLIKRYHRPN